MSVFSGIAYHFDMADKSLSIVLIYGLVTDAAQCSFHTRSRDLIADHLGWRIDYCQRASAARYRPKSLNG